MNGEKGLENECGEWERKKWEQTRELEMKLLIGLGFKLGFFFPNFHFPVPRSPFPVPRFGNIPPGVSLAPGLSLLLSLHAPQR